MISCPKCGSSRINGPFYKAACYPARDLLKYICAQCGYSGYEVPLDRRQEDKDVPTLAQHGVK
jgi:DNA-directed RNA polymerase subunit RPC12/RpoP